MIRLKMIIMVLLSVFAIGITVVYAQDTAAKDAAAPEAWSPSTAGPITTWTAPLCSKNKLAVQPLFFYTHTRGEFDSEGDYHSLGKGNRESQYQQQLLLEYGITDKLEIDIHTTYSENYAKDGDARAHSDGFADESLNARYCLQEESKSMPCTTVLFQLKAPTGKYKHDEDSKLDSDVMGTGSWDPGFGVIMTKHLKPFVLHGDLTYTVPQKVNIDGITSHAAPYANYDFAVEYILPKGFNLMAELNGVCQGDRKEFGKNVPASDSSSLVFAPGVGWSNDKIQMLVAYQRTLCGTNVDANDSVVFTIMHTF